MRKPFLITAALSLVVPAHLLCAQESDATLVNRNLAKILQTAESIEHYRIIHDRLPKAWSPVDLAYALGHPGMEEFFTDPWGTPYRIDANPGKGSYMIISAGSDRQFDSASWPHEEALDNAREDTVFRDGKFIRSARQWAASSAGPPVEVFGDALSWSKARRSMADLTTISTGLELYRIDHHRYPDAKDIDALRAAIVPEYLREMPSTDGWGTPLRVDCRADRCTIIAAGADQKFEGSLPAGEEFTSDLSKDLLLLNGKFVRQWRPEPAAAVHESVAGVFVAQTRLDRLLNASPEERRKIKVDGLLQEAQRLFNDDALASACDFAAAVQADPHALTADPMMDYARLLEINIVEGPPPPPPRPGYLSYPPPFADTPAGAVMARVVKPLIARYAAEHPDDAAAMRANADVIARTESPGAAVKMLETVTAGHPRNTAAWIKLAQFRHKLHDDQGALAALDRAAALQPSLSDADTIAWLYKSAGNPKASLPVIESVSKAHPDDAEAWWEVGAWAYNVSSTENDPLPLLRKAQSAFEKALSINPRHVQSMSYLSLVLRQRARLSSDPAEKQKLTAEADRLRDQAKEIIRKQREPGKQ